MAGATGVVEDLLVGVGGWRGLLGVGRHLQQRHAPQNHEELPIYLQTSCAQRLDARRRWSRIRNSLAFPQRPGSSKDSPLLHCGVGALHRLIIHVSGAGRVRAGGGRGTGIEPSPRSQEWSMGPGGPPRSTRPRSERETAERVPNGSAGRLRLVHPGIGTLAKPISSPLIDRIGWSGPLG